LAKQFKELISTVRQVSSVYIVYSTSIDSIISASLLLKFFKDQDIDAYLAPFHEAPKPWGEHIVIGIGTLQKPISGVRFVTIDDYLGKEPGAAFSTAVYLIKQVKEYWIVPRALEALALVAMVSLSKSTLYDEMLIDVHKAILADAISKDVWEYSESLRLFGFPQRDIVEALKRTLEPYIVGLSLDEANAPALVKRIQSESKKDLIQAVASEAEGILSRYSRLSPKLIGQKIIVKNVDEVEDVYEAVYALSLYLDLKGSEPLLSIAFEPNIMKYLTSLLYATMKQFKPLLDAIIQGAGVKRYVIKGVRVSVVDISSEPRMPPLHTLYRVLRGIGLVDEITMFTNGKEYFLPLQLLEPRWPLDKELHIENSYIVLSSLQSLGEIIK
jgi:hypothetical protein